MIADRLTDSAARARDWSCFIHLEIVRDSPFCTEILKSGGARTNHFIVASPCLPPLSRPSSSLASTTSSEAIPKRITLWYGFIFSAVLSNPLFVPLLLTWQFKISVHPFPRPSLASTQSHKFHHIEFWCGDAQNTAARFGWALGMNHVAQSNQVCVLHLLRLFDANAILFFRNSRSAISSSVSLSPIFLIS